MKPRFRIYFVTTPYKCITIEPLNVAAMVYVKIRMFLPQYNHSNRYPCFSKW